MYAHFFWLTWPGANHAPKYLAEIRSFHKCSVHVARNVNNPGSATEVGQNVCQGHGPQKHFTPWCLPGRFHQGVLCTHEQTCNKTAEVPNPFKWPGPISLQMCLTPETKARPMARGTGVCIWLSWTIHKHSDGRSYLTSWSCESKRTMTMIGVVSVIAGSHIETRVGVAGIDVVLAVGACVSWSTFTLVRVDTIYACPTIQARTEMTQREQYGSSSRLNSLAM